MMGKIGTLAALLCVLAPWSVAHAAPGARVALVIANAEYAGRNHLANPPRDAAMMKIALAKAGFEVVDAPLDLGHDAFYHALKIYHAEAKNAEVAFVYYAGHAIQAGGHNWLIPVDAELEEESDLNLEAVDLETVLSAVEGAKWRVVALDACRNNPFGERWSGHSRAYQGAGLGAIEADNVLVMFAAAANQTASDGADGQDSPFATALAHRLAQPGLTIQLLGDVVRDDVLTATAQKQRPFISASISAEPFFLVAGSAAAPTTAAVQAPDPQATEVAFWNTVNLSGDVRQDQMYLDRYPQGQFAPIARMRVRDSIGREARTALEAISQRAWNVDPLNSLFFRVIAATSMGELQKAAEAGDSRAQVMMGFARTYAAGGLDRDGPAALRWYAMAADQNEARGMLGVGFIHQQGLGVPKDAAEALRWHRKAAETGSAAGQNTLGFDYYSGLGSPRDPEEAIRWFRKSADQGNPVAMLNLAETFEWGLGQPQDFTEALNWYRRSAELGYSGGQIELGDLLATNKAAPADYAGALRWYRKAADQGDPGGQVAIGRLYATGRGVAQDYVEAARWYRKAIDSGAAHESPGVDLDEDTANAECELGRLYAAGHGVPQDGAQALRWFRKAADLGSATGQVEMGRAYAAGEGVAADAAVAMRWFRTAADQGDAQGQVEVGALYETGHGVARDYVEAMRWYRKAADQAPDDNRAAIGIAAGQRAVALLYAGGLGVTADQGLALRWMKKAADLGNLEAQAWLAKNA